MASILIRAEGSNAARNVQRLLKNVPGIGMVAQQKKYRLVLTGIFSQAGPEPWKARPERLLSLPSEGAKQQKRG